jgi:hypothetical protein
MHTEFLWGNFVENIPFGNRTHGERNVKILIWAFP